MKSDASTPEEYVKEVPEDRREAFSRLRETMIQHLPEGFEECMTYGMIGYVIPHSLYPEGYHVDPKQPLPFAAIASQKNFIALYHSGVYADDGIKEWFQQEYARQMPTKLDMGKSCIRFKNPKNIPFDLIGELSEKITPEEYISIYENARKTRQK